MTNETRHIANKGGIGRREFLTTGAATLALGVTGFPAVLRAQAQPVAIAFALQHPGDPAGRQLAVVLQARAPGARAACTSCGWPPRASPARLARCRANSRRSLLARGSPLRRLQSPARAVRPAAGCQTAPAASPSR